MLYRSALHAERTRQEMFAKDELPLGTINPSPSGQWNGADFAEFSDADPRIGAHLEAFIAGSYTWIPFAYVESIEVEAPKKLRDLLWMAAILHTTSDFRLQDLGEVLLPAISPLSWGIPTMLFVLVARLSGKRTRSTAKCLSGKNCCCAGMKRSRSCNYGT